MSRGRLRSLAVSLVTTGLDAGLFALCTLTLMGPLLVVARWCTGAVGAGANFALNRVWAFRVRRGGVARQLLRYAVTSAVAVSLATAIWWLLARVTPWDPRLLHLVSLALVWLAFTFPMLRGWVFRQVGAGGCGLGGGATPRSACRSERARTGG